MADSTLVAVRTLVRRLTRSPSTAQASDSYIDEKVNTFIQYDFPESLRLFSLRETFSFYTQPNIDTYETTTSVSTDPLYNFKNKYITVHTPIYIEGYESFFSLDRTSFYRIYPIVSQEQQINQTGDGVTVLFTGTLPNIPVLPDNVLFSAIDANNNAMTYIDDFQTSILGNLILPNDPATIVGTIDYVSGAYSITFPNPPAMGQNITCETFSYQASRPNALLYFDDKFVVRPVPDKAYKVQMEVYRRPTELLSAGTSPELEQWWQYISYGAAIKVFQERMDLESVQLITPEFKRQENFVLRRTIVQQTEQRTATIYTDTTAGAYGNGWFNGGGNF